MDTSNRLLLWEIPRLAVSDVTLSTRTSSALQILQQAGQESMPAAFSSSLGAEDMVLTDLIFRHNLKIEIFTIDTGRLPPETLELLARTEAHYGKRLRTYFPNFQNIETYIEKNGINGFYESSVLRKDCCYVRKVIPLQRALAGKGAWITGLRSEQSASRNGIAAFTQDANYDLMKASPLHDWQEAEVWAYIRYHNVPYNVLHDRGYPSIGCAPCTRAVAADAADIRAGRWWWETDENKECGLHMDAQGRLVRNTSTTKP